MMPTPTRDLGGATAWLSWRAAACAGLLSVAALVAGCGGGGGDPGAAPPPVAAAPVGDPVTQTLGASGGTVEAVSSGVKVRLSFPAGALSADTAVTITPQVLAAGDVASVKLAPGGVVFAQPVTVVLEYPAGQVPDAKASLRQQLGGADSFVATVVDVSARTLSTRLTTFGGAVLDALAKPADAPAGRARALGAKALAAPAAPGAGNLSAASSTSLAELIASIRRQVTIMENVGDFEGAFALQASIASLLNRRGDVDFPVTATPFIKEAHDTACTALSAAMADAKAARPKKAAEFKPLREKVGNWWVIADQTNIYGTGCPGATIDDFSEAAIDLTTREAALQAQELKQVKSEVGVLVKQAKMAGAAAALKVARKNKLEFEALKAAATALDLPPLPPQTSDRAHPTSARPLEVHDSGYAAIIQTVLLDPLMAPAREAAWTMAKGSATLAQYPPLIDAFGSAPALQQDVQFVRTRISARVVDGGGNTAASSTLGFDAVPDLPADPKRSDTLTLSPGTTLALSGNIANLECASAGEETLTVTFKGVQVASVSGSGGNLLAGALSTLTRAGLLSAAALPADDKGSYPLLIRRAVSPCATALGISDDLLATLTLSFNDRKIVFSHKPLTTEHGWEIYAINEDGSGLVLVTSNPPVPSCGENICSVRTANDTSPSSSPDGKRIVFARQGGVSSSSIMLVSADGSGLPQSVAVAGVGEDFWTPSWSPDGARIAFVRRQYSTSGQPKTIIVLNINGGGRIEIMANAYREGTSALAWSPDGTKIAYAGTSDGNVANAGIYAVNADGSGAPTLLVADSNYDPAISPSGWSPDGRKIVFTGNPNGNSHGIWAMNVDGTGLSLLTVAILYSGMAPSWSPDGNKIGYGGDDSQIWVMNADGSNPKQVTSGLVDIRSPAWR